MFSNTSVKFVIIEEKQVCIFNYDQLWSLKKNKY